MISTRELRISIVQSSARNLCDETDLNLKMRAVNKQWVFVTVHQ